MQLIAFRRDCGCRNIGKKSSKNRKFLLNLLAVTPATISADVRVVTLYGAVQRRIEVRGGVLLTYHVESPKPSDVNCVHSVAVLREKDAPKRKGVVVRLARRRVKLIFETCDVAVKFSHAVMEAVRRVKASKSTLPSLRIVATRDCIDMDAASASLLNFGGLSKYGGLAEGETLVRVMNVQGRGSKSLILKSVRKADALFTATDMRHTVDQRVALERAAMWGSPFLAGLILAFETSDAFNFVTRAPEMGTLAHLILASPHNRLSEAVARCLFAEISLALRDVHLLGLLFRNLSPDSVSLTAQGHVRLHGFDLAKPVCEPLSAMCQLSSRQGNGKEPVEVDEDFAQLGRAHSFVGKRLFMSPEHLSSEPGGSGSYGKAVDFWASGVTLYIMLTGRHPFAKRKTMMNAATSLFSKIETAELSFPEHVSVDAQRLIEGLLDRDEESRYGLHDIKRSAWMDSVDWDVVEARTVKQEPHDIVLRATSAATAHQRTFNDAADKCLLGTNGDEAAVLWTSVNARPFPSPETATAGGLKRAKGAQSVSPYSPRTRGALWRKKKSALLGFGYIESTESLA